jgi:hypothetical protein
LDGLESPQQKLPKPPQVLDLPDDRFDDPFARCIHRRAPLRAQRAGHPMDDRRVLRQRAARTRPQLFAMFCLRVAIKASMFVAAIAVRLSFEQ